MSDFDVKDMPSCSDDDNSVYQVTNYDIQATAWEMMGRRLTNDELHTARKCVEYGLSESHDVVFRTAVQEALITH